MSIAPLLMKQAITTSKELSGGVKLPVEPLLDVRLVGV
jgi:hypothetical protein